MSEYEAVYLFREMISDIHQSMFSYISLLSAFLVTSYLVADKLSTVLVVILITLYSLIALNFVFQFSLISTDAVNLYEYILERKVDGSYDLTWFGENPEWAGRLVTITRLCTAAGGYIGSLAFFFYQRKRKNVA